jgi:hypothetical protein
MNNTWYVNKTNMPMFDVERAYGLAEVLSRIVSRMISIKDLGNTYVIGYDGPPPKANENKKNLESLFVESTKFDDSLATQWRDRQGIIDATRNLVVNRIEDILNFYSNSASQARFSTKKGPDRMTLYQSLDVTASKSIRELKIGLTYSEGGQLYVDQLNFAVALVGSAYFRYFRRTLDRDFMLSIIPNPAEVNLLSHMDIQRDIGEERLCRLSGRTILSHYAVSLSFLLGKTRERGGYLNAYDYLIFNEMRQTGKQFKPSASGKFPLEYCLRLSQSDEGMEALNLMGGIFRRGFVRGHPQRVAFALAHFISEPTLDNYLRYIDLHVRGYIEKDKNKRISSLYNESALKECVKYVKYS